MIKAITFDEILPIWSEKLWLGRVSQITATSAMTYLGGYDYENMKGEPTFFGYFVEGEIAGVNSGHMTMNQAYRSRGLYVDPTHRNKGIGLALLLATIEQARLEDAEMCWSYPKLTSWSVYEKAGFRLTSDWEKSEMSDHNAYCRADINLTE